MNKEIYLLSPEDLNLDLILKERDPKGKLNKDFLRYTIHLVIVGNIYAFQIKKSRHSETFVVGQEHLEDSSIILFEYRHIHLYSKFLEMIHWKYKDHMKWLVLNNILIRNPYSKGKSYSYNLDRKYQKSKLTANAVESYIVQNKIKAFYKSKPTTSPKKFAPLIKNFDRNLLSVDMESTLIYLNDGLDDGTIRYDLYIRCLAFLTDIHNGRIWYSHNPDSDGRLHSTLTHLPRIARQFLTYKGKKLVEVDVRNSTANILLYAVSATVSPPDLIQSALNSDSLSSSFIMFKELAETIDNIELDHFKELVLSGSLYTVIGEDIRKYVIDDKGDDTICKELIKESYTGTKEQIRAIGKQAFLCALYGNNRSYLYAQVILKLRFPTIMQWVVDFRSYKRDKDWHKKLSHALMQIEAKIMLTFGAIGFHNRKKGKVPVFTLHDCLITTENYKDELLAHLQQAFKSNIGFTPAFKMVDWTAEEDEMTFPSPDVDIELIEGNKAAYDEQNPVLRRISLPDSELASLDAKEPPSRAVMNAVDAYNHFWRQKGRYKGNAKNLNEQNPELSVLEHLSPGEWLYRLDNNEVSDHGIYSDQALSDYERISRSIDRHLAKTA